MSNTNQSMTIMDFVNLASKKGVEIHIQPNEIIDGAVVIRLGHKDFFSRIKHVTALTIEDIERRHVPVDRILIDALKELGIDLEDVENGTESSS